MSEHAITVEGGSSVRLLTEGKYCDRNIVVTAIGGAGGDTGIEDALVTGTITSYSNDRITTVGGYAFAGRNSLTDIDLPNVASVGASAFYRCNSLTNVNLPEVTAIGAYAFSNCDSLTDIKLPKATTIGNFAFEGGMSSLGASTSKLRIVDLPEVRSIGSYVFRQCYVLKALILRYNDVCSAEAATTIGSSIAEGSGYIYVPSKQLSRYRSAAGWSTFAAQLRALEDYTVDGTTTGELDETKI